MLHNFATVIVSELIRLFLNKDKSLPITGNKPPINSHYFSETFFHFFKSTSMNSARRLPFTNIGCYRTLNLLDVKHKSVDLADSAIAPATAVKLGTIGSTPFINAMDNVTASEEVQRLAKESVDIHRVLLHDNITIFFTSLNGGIKLKLIPNSARAYFGLDVSNKNLPDINTDLKMTDWANKIITGDTERVKQGGYVINIPDTISFTAVLAANKASLITFSNAKSALSAAQAVVNTLRPGVDNLIKHAWNEIENNFSALPAPALRAASRPWSVQYISNGTPAFIFSKCTDSKTGLPIPGVEVHLEGIANKEKSDVAGDTKLGTSQYGDLNLLASVKDYKDADISFTMENGVDIIVNIVMEHL